MGYKRALQSDLQGGMSVPESAKLFLKILKGDGTKTQNEVVTANAQMALKCYWPSRSFEECREITTASLLGGKAYQSFNKLIKLQ